MGTWNSSDLLGNDSACKYFGDTINKIVADLEQDLATLDNGILERDFGVCILLLNALAARAPTDVGISIAHERISFWRTQIGEWHARVSKSEPVWTQTAWRESAECIGRELDSLASRLAAEKLP